MELRNLFADEDAVSPVIGVILMVAITVILAAVIGTFVLGLGENVQDSAPQANFQFEYSGDFVNQDSLGTASDGRYGRVQVTHTGGEDISANTVTVQVGSETAYDGSDGSSDGDWTLENNNWGSGSSSTIATGSSVDIIDGDSDDQTSSTVRVVWTSPSGGTSNTIGQSTVPS